MVQRMYVYSLDGNPTFPKGYQVLLDDDYPIPDGWVLLAPVKISLSDLAPPPAPSWALPPAPLPVATIKVNAKTSITGKTKKKRLTAQGEKVKSEWENLYKAEGCTCHKSSPCPHCLHPGHPYSLENNTALWEDEPEKTRADAIMDAIREMAGKGNT